MNIKEYFPWGETECGTDVHIVLLLKMGGILPPFPFYNFIGMPATLLFYCLATPTCG
jgi:hypothetical protein